MQRARAGAAGTAQVKELPPRCARRGLGGLQPIRLVRRATAASPRSLPPASSLQRPPPRTLESLRWLCNCTLTGSAVGRSRACYVLRAACYPCCVRGRTGSACLAGVRWSALEAVGSLHLLLHLHSSGLYCTPDCCWGALCTPLRTAPILTACSNSKGRVPKRWLRFPSG